MKTYVATAKDTKQEWYVVDAAGQTLGRMAARIAAILRGKHKPRFTLHHDTGDFVVVINADKVRLTGNKLDTKQHIHHSGYPGGFKSIDYRTLMQKSPERAIVYAVNGMLPHNHLGRKQAKKLHVYRGAVHPHAAQMPKPLDLKTI